MVPDDAIPGLLQLGRVFDTDVTQGIEAASEDGSWREVLETGHRLHSGRYVRVRRWCSEREIVVCEEEDSVTF